MLIQETCQPSVITIHLTLPCDILKW